MLQRYHLVESTPRIRLAIFAVYGRYLTSACGFSLKATAVGTQLVVGTVFVMGTLAVHIGCLVAIAAWLRSVATRFRRDTPTRRALLIGSAVFAIIVIHSAEIWGWALLYLWFGEFAELSDALYFSAVTATTLGYGDIVLSDAWRIVATFEAMAGLILFGASTAFLIEIFRRLLFSAHPDQ